MNKARLHGSVTSRGLAAEISAAARCGETLERMGVQIVFRSGGDKTLKVTLRDISGSLLSTISPQHLFDLIALDGVELEAWVARLQDQPNEAARA